MIRRSPGARPPSSRLLFCRCPYGFFPPDGRLVEILTPYLTIFFRDRIFTFHWHEEDLSFNDNRGRRWSPDKTLGTFLASAPMIAVEKSRKPRAQRSGKCALTRLSAPYSVPRAENC